jgi:hypothetical protein
VCVDVSISLTLYILLTTYEMESLIIIVQLGHVKGDRRGL